MSKKRKTAAWVMERLRKRFPEGAFAFLEQVRNGTGYVRSERYADAIVVSCWPTRGLWLGGIEVKVTKSDWRKELATPEKADAIQRHCQYWWVAAPKGVVPESEVPEKWGLIECTEHGANDTRAASKCEVEPVDMLFFASLCRSLDKCYVPKWRFDEIRKLDRVEHMGYIQEVARLEPVERSLERLRNAVSKFEAASGVSISKRWAAGNIGKAVKEVCSGKTAARYADDLRGLANTIIETLNTEVP